MARTKTDPSTKTESAAPSSVTITNTGTRRVSFDLSEPTEDGKGIKPRQIRFGAVLDQQTPDPDPVSHTLSGDDFARLKTQAGFADLVSRNVLTVQTSRAA